MATISYDRIEVTLNDGSVVLGKDTKYGHCALTYSNRTQASKAALRERGEVIQRGRPFYVRLYCEANRAFPEREQEA